MKSYNSMDIFYYKYVYLNNNLYLIFIDFYIYNLNIFNNYAKNKNIENLIEVLYIYKFYKFILFLSYLIF